jgi:hypothetical protein
MPAWHAEVTELVLRRFDGAAGPREAAAAFAANRPYAGVAIARIDLGKATVGPMLATGSRMSRAEHAQLEEILRAHGARELVITRHGRLVVRGG